jgi:hypothetical protein
MDGEGWSISPTISLEMVGNGEELEFEQSPNEAKGNKRESNNPHQSLHNCLCPSTVVCKAD